MKSYLKHKIMEECAALSNAVLLGGESEDGAAFAVRTIGGRLGSFVREYLMECDREKAFAEER